MATPDFRAVLVASTATLLLVPGCSGARPGGASLQPPAISSTVPHYNGPLGDATFHVRIPGRSNAGARRASYVSPATKSLRFVIDSSSRISGTATTGTLGAYNALPWSTFDTGTLPSGSCPASGSDFVCTVVVPLPPGSDTITVTAYDNTGGTGNTLSQQVQTFTVSTGVTNSFSLVLDANAAAMVVSGSGSCQNGPIGSSFGTVGTTPVTFSVAYTDAAGKTIVAPGLPHVSVVASGVSGGTIGVAVDQSAQTYTLTPSSAGVSGTITVTASQADSTGSSDGLSFTRTKTYTFASGNPPPASFLAAVEQFGVGSGAVDLFTVALGGSGAADTISPYTPATLATTNSTNEGKPDVDNPLNLAFDSAGDLLVANGGTTTGSPPDYGNLACIPVGAIATGQNTSTTVTPNVDDPGGLTYDSRDGTVAIANTSGIAAIQLATYLLAGNYTPAPSGRNLSAPGYASYSVVNVPTRPAGTFAVALTDGLETDPAHNTGKSKIAIVTPTSATTSTETDIVDGGSPNYSVDIPRSLAWDGVNSQLVIANDSAFHKFVTFYTVTPVALAKTVDTGRRNYAVAASPDGHIAAAGTGAFGYTQVQVYDNTAARNAVNGPIPFNGTTTACGSIYLYGTGSVVNSLRWVSNTKLLIALQSYNGSTATAQNGLYVFDISATAVPTGFDDVSCHAFAAAPKQTGFVHIANKPLGTAYRP